jgi:hypothetical protein
VGSIARGRSLRAKRFSLDFNRELRDSAFLDAILGRIEQLVASQSIDDSLIKKFNSLTDKLIKGIEARSNDEAFLKHVGEELNKSIKSTKVLLKRKTPKPKKISAISQDTPAGFPSFNPSELDFPGIVNFYLPGIYEIIARDEGENYDKWKVLRAAEASQARMISIFFDNDTKFIDHLIDYSFFQAVPSKSEFGNNPRQIREKLWTIHKPKFKSGPIAYKEDKSKEAKREAYRAILEILNPRFSNRKGNKIESLYDAVRWVNGQLDSGKTLDEDGFVDEYAAARKARQVAIFLTSRLFDISESTVERAIKPN